MSRRDRNYIDGIVQEVDVKVKTKDGIKTIMFETPEIRQRRKKKENKPPKSVEEIRKGNDKILTKDYLKNILEQQFSMNIEDREKKKIEIINKINDLEKYLSHQERSRFREESEINEELRDDEEKYKDLAPIPDIILDRELREERDDNPPSGYAIDLQNQGISGDDIKLFGHIVYKGKVNKVNPTKVRDIIWKYNFTPYEIKTTVAKYNQLRNEGRTDNEIIEILIPSI